LNVVVRDARGRIVRNLASSDFSITEDGTAAAVSSAKFVDARKGGPVRLTLIFDRMRGESARLSRISAQALVSLADANARFSVWAIDRKLLLLQSSTANHKAVNGAIQAATGKAAPRGMDPAAGESAAAERAILQTAARLSRDGRFLPAVAALIAAAREQEALGGRKAIIYFSDGLPVGAGDECLLAIASAASEANVAVYAVDATAMAITNDEQSARDAAINGRGIGYMPTFGAATQGPVNRRAATPGPSVAVGQRSTPLDLVTGKAGGFTITRSNDVRASMRRVLEDVESYYEIAYSRPSAALDGRYHQTVVSAKRGRVRGPEGFYASPDGSNGEFLAYELPLFDALRRAPIFNFPVYAEVMQFRGANPGLGLASLDVEIFGKGLRFEEDAAAGFFRAHISVMALVRDSGGAIVERFSRDMPFQTPPNLVEETRNRRFLLQERLELAPGDYTLETAVQDLLADHCTTAKTPFTVAPPASGLGISSLTLVRGVAAAGKDAVPDGAFQLFGKSVVPALDRAIAGGPGAVARLFFRVYPETAAEPLELAFEILRNGQPVIHKPLKTDSPADGAGQVITLDVAALPAGTYDLKAIATQGTRQASAQTNVEIQGGPEELAANPEIAVGPAAELPSTPPNAEQERLLEQARSTALQYTEHLPNFMCTQVTRRLVDDAGKEQWRNLDESTQLVAFYDGHEHYDALTDRTMAADSDRYPPSMRSSGEFGSLLKSIFQPESAAKFAWVRADSLRDRAVEVFSYAVDLAHSQYRVSHIVQGRPKAVLSAFHGLVYVDEETGAVSHMTQETDALPEDFPVRQMSLSLEYGDVSVGGQVYTLPLSFTIDVRTGKRTVVRNEVGFRSCQRFTADSRLLPAGQ